MGGEVKIPPPHTHTPVNAFRLVLFANSNFKDLLFEGALFNSEIEIQCVSEHVWVGGRGLRGRGGEQPAGGIRASQGTFSSLESRGIVLSM